MTPNMSSQFAGMKASRGHLSLEAFPNAPNGITIVSIQNKSAGMIAEGGSPTESQGAQPEFIREVSHVLAKTSIDIGEQPMEEFILLQKRKIRI
tara:strand:+ start:8149 stop:8430 length:282 start_codon:yes stop_codon:yes gene_type:complete